LKVSRDRITGAIARDPSEDEVVALHRPRGELLPE